MFYQYCRYRKFDQYWVCIVIMSYWPLHCTLYITFIDIMNIAKQILHQFLHRFFISCLHQTSCLHRQRRHRNVFPHWMTLSLHRAPSTLFTSSTTMTKQCSWSKSNWYWVVFLSSCLHRKFGQHRVTSRLHRTLSIFFALSTSQCWQASSLHGVSPYPYYFIFMVNVALFGDTKLTLRREHTLSIMFYIVDLAMLATIELTLCLHCVPSIFIK